jgi:hypothetical protein
MDIGRFIRAHLWHLLLLAPGLLLATVVHEAAHAAAVIGQGGRILDFVWVPSLQEWGHVRYRFPTDAGHSEFVISLAPYVAATCLAGLATLASFRSRPWSYRAASGWYVWAFLVPLAEIANAVFVWLAGGDNDLLQAFGPPTLAGFIAVGSAVLASLVWGGWLQRRLYQERALSLVACTALSLATVMLVAAASVGLALL